jgi:DNA-directed RNA polymerase sigma subunit (sigma70/sigma32)
MEKTHRSNPAYAKLESDPLTNLVMEYKENSNPLILLKIYNSTKRLVYGVFKYYDIIRSFPVHIQDDIEEDCRSFVLLKTIERFDSNKNTKFSTLYTWWLKSYVNAKKQWYLRRNPLWYDTLDINMDLGKFNNVSLTLGDTLTDWSIQNFSAFKKEIQEIFK